MGPSLPDFFRLTALAATASTNDVALARAAEGAPEGTLITARRQSAGRGRRGRTWTSPEGNLHLSLVLTPPVGARDAAAVGFAAALAVADAVAACVPPAREVQVKWPNDVLLGGAKVAGLLIETVPGRADALVLGIGVNVIAHPAGTPYPATDLRAEGAAVDAGDVLAAFAPAFLVRYQGFRTEGFAPLRAAWLARAKGVGEAIAVRLEGARFDGTFAGIDADGALVLDLGGGTQKKITAGDVFFGAT